MQARNQGFAKGGNFNKKLKYFCLENVLLMRRAEQPKRIAKRDLGEKPPAEPTEAKRVLGQIFLPLGNFCDLFDQK